VTYLLVLLGGAIGAPMRYLLDSRIQRRISRPFPFGTLGVNVAGCLILGLLAGGLATGRSSTTLYTLLGTGFCGGFTTFSTFSVEAVELAGAGRRGSAAAYVLISCVAGLAAAGIGYAVV
jgi:fluoride exporter